MIASGSNAQIFELDSGKQIDVLSSGGSDTAKDAVFLPKSHQFITTGSGSVDIPHMHIWNIKSNN